MKRAALVGIGTAAGIAAVLALNPEAGTASTAQGTASVAPSTTGGSSSSTASSGATTTDGTVTGDAVDVGRGYGDIQVEVTVSGGRLVDITALAVPRNDPRSAQISQYAVPELVQQALSAQGASIAGISGATYTSAGFAASLRSALVAAGITS